MGVKLPFPCPSRSPTPSTVAGEKSDVDFDYLLQHGDPRVAASTPSAKAGDLERHGVVPVPRFSTWLQVMKQEGPRLGYQPVRGRHPGRLAMAITTSPTKQLKAGSSEAARRPAGGLGHGGGVHAQSNGDLPVREASAGCRAPASSTSRTSSARRARRKLFDAGLSRSRPERRQALSQRQAKRQPGTIFYDHGGEARTIREVYRGHWWPSTRRRPRAMPRFAAQQLVTGGGQADPLDSPTPLAFADAYSNPGKWPDATPIPSRFWPR
jgi:hypothetical protein